MDIQESTKLDLFYLKEKIFCLFILNNIQKFVNQLLGKFKTQLHVIMKRSNWLFGCIMIETTKSRQNYLQNLVSGKKLLNENLIDLNFIQFHNEISICFRYSC